MPTSIVRYRKASDDYTTYTLRGPDAPDTPQLIELCTLDDGYTYVAVPDGVALPEQPAEIAASVETVTLDAELRDQIKAASPHCQLIARLTEERIRERYSLSDEQYFARIGVGVALGVYEFEPGEQDELLAFGAYVESCRQWGRSKRAELGL